MANRQNTLLLKRSNIIGKIPPLSGLTLGEMALNTADAKLYSLYTSGSPSPSEVRQIGWDRISRTGDTVFGDFAISGSSLPSGYALSVTGDTNFVGDIYVQGDLNYDGNLIVSGGTIVESGFTANTIYTDYIDFNTNATVTSSNGRIYWDSGTGTLNVSVGDTGTGLIDLQVGQEEIVRVFNDEATTLVKGEIVYVSGSQGNRPKVKRALATSDGYSVTTLGMVDRNITSGAEGYVTTFGIISNLNTIGLTGGTAIWLSGTVPGGYTSDKPIAPLHTVLIGYVVRVSATVGSIFVNISNGWELDELHDVRISAATEGDLLMRSSFSGTPLWVNTKTLNGSYTITGNTNIGGNLTVSGNSGTSWFSSNTSSDLVRVTQTGSGNAFVVEDSNNPDSTPFRIDASGNTAIGVTTSPLSFKLEVNGTSMFRDNMFLNQALFSETYVYNSFTDLNKVNLNVNRFHDHNDGAVDLGYTARFGWNKRQSSNISLARSIDIPVNFTSGSSGTVGQFNSINTFLQIQETSTITTPFVAHSVSATKGTTGTVTSFTGFDVQDNSVSNTTYGFRSRLTSGSGKYGLYFDGTANNYFNGNVGIGTSTPREKLDVSGNTIISSGLSASTVTITTQPTSGYTSTQILMRNSTSGQVEITDSTSPSIYNYGMSYAMTTFNYLT